MPRAELPPFASVLKSREVEDPVNLWLHRPLAYAFVVLFFRTRLTPNQITLLATIVGVASAPFMIEGSPRSMLIAGILVWSSAILDGADGIMARAKKMQSDYGRALDGTADMVVAVTVLLSATYHLWDKHHDPLLMLMLALVAASTVLHVYMYDYYKESYMSFIRPDFKGRFETSEEVQLRLNQLVQDRAPFVQRFATRLYVGLLANQKAAVALTNPAGSREGLQFQVNSMTAEHYRRMNRAPIRVWIWVSLAPHCYLLSIFTMFDRIDAYVWLRLIGINAIFVVALVLQRKRSGATLAELKRLGRAPVAM